jgi:hypothetical protein
MSDNPTGAPAQSVRSAFYWQRQLSTLASESELIGRLIAYVESALPELTSLLELAARFGMSERSWKNDAQAWRGDARRVQTDYVRGVVVVRVQGKSTKIPGSRPRQKIDHLPLFERVA